MRPFDVRVLGHGALFSASDTVTNWRGDRQVFRDAMLHARCMGIPNRSQCRYQNNYGQERFLVDSFPKGKPRTRAVRSEDLVGSEAWLPLKLLNGVLNQHGRVNWSR